MSEHAEERERDDEDAEGHRGSWRSWSTWRIVLRVMVAVVLVVAVILWQGEFLGEKVEPGTVSWSAPALAGRPTVTVQRSEVPRTRELLGSLRARETIMLAPEVGGRLLRVTVAAGDRVSEGDVLVQLDPEVLEAETARADAAVEVARARLDGAEEQLARIRAGVEADVATELQLVAAEQARDSAQAQLEARRQAAAAARARLEDATVRSPADGVVIDTFREEGDVLAPGQPVLSLFDPDRVEVQVAVPESLLGQLTPGRTLEVVIDALGGSRTAVVRTTVPRADPATRSAEVRLRLDLPADALPGMFVRVKVPGDPRPVIAVPASAVGTIGQLRLVWVVRDDRTLARRLIRAGDPLDEDRVEVLAGLDDGQRILETWVVDPAAERRP